jgi:transposase-like protein
VSESIIADVAEGRGGVESSAGYWLRGEQSVPELRRREGISESLYYRWSKEFLEAGKERLASNTKGQVSNQDGYRLGEDVIPTSEYSLKLSDWKQFK